MTNLNINRRNFLKAAGVTGAIGAAAASVAVAVPSVAKAEYNQPATTLTNMAITYLDEPSYNLSPYADGDKLERFPASNAAFFSQEFYADYLDGKSYFVALEEKKIERLVNGDVGFSLRDFAFLNAMSVSQNNAATLLDWNVSESSYLSAVGKWEDTEENNTLSIKKTAYCLGACAVGVAELNRNWIFSSSIAGIDIRFEDVETFSKSTEAYIIPNSVNRVIMIAVPMEGTISKYSDAVFGGHSASFHCYSWLTEIGAKISTFIRTLGYNAIAEIHDIGLNIPMAIDAGLGELGRNGLLINPEYGPNIRLIKVLTDLPLSVDKPITFGAAEFCKTCMKCADNCPSKSISMDVEPSYDTYCSGNNAGMKKWYVNVFTCLKYWTEIGGNCTSCQQTCTYSKPQTWVHDVVKVISSKTTVFNSIFATMDDAFGYGKGTDDIDYNEIEEWWADPVERPFMITKM